MTSHGTKSDCLESLNFGFGKIVKIHLSLDGWFLHGQNWV